MLCTLATLPEHPMSVPVNRLMPMEGTPLEKAPPVEDIEVARGDRLLSSDDAAGARAFVGGAQRDERRGAGALFLRRGAIRSF